MRVNLRGAFTGLLVLWGSALCPPAVAEDFYITSELIVDGLTHPLYLTTAPGDDFRLFVAEKEGLVRIIEDGVLLPTPFLDISSLISTGGPQGLLGLAMHPDHQEPRERDHY